MGGEIPLFNVGLSQAELDSLMEEIRSSSYIDEVESGEVPRTESGLWNTVLPVEERPHDTSMPSLIKAAKGKAALVVADGKLGKSVLVVQIKDGAKVDELKVAPKDVIEVCSNLAIASMDLCEFKSMSKGAEIFDSGR
ncbi:hypothetical protein CBS101457_006072 [Exobasidium rhododendri]|nr:hypothetical protein CBS101457_006072 [Exobasidium rhododendri]